MRLIDADVLPEISLFGTTEYINVRKAPTVPAIPMERIKEARDEIERNAYPIVHGVNNHDMGMTINGIFQVVDNMIKEYE